MLEIKNISKTYEDKSLLANISFKVKQGETICLLGASGSGKSTLLRIIAGLESSERGLISFDGMDITFTPTHLRDFGLVFQDYALFPHLDVFDNVAFGLKARRSNWQFDLLERVDEALGLVNMKGFERRRVTELSGGEQQRVALARALAPHPRLLMFDEPLGALDRTLKEDVLNELRGILHRTKIPAIYVTHDQEEAFAIADKILLLHDGAIVQEGTPADVWSNPKSAWAAKFLGAGNVVEGIVTRASTPLTGQASRSAGFIVKTAFGAFNVKCKHKHKKGERVSLLLKQSKRGEKIKLRVEDMLFKRDQFEVKGRGGLVIHMNEKPKIGQTIVAHAQVTCLEE